MIPDLVNHTELYFKQHHSCNKNPCIHIVPDQVSIQLGGGGGEGRGGIIGKVNINNPLWAYGVTLPTPHYLVLAATDERAVPPNPTGAGGIFMFTSCDVMENV